MARRATTQMAKKNASNDPSYRKLKADYYPVQRSWRIRSSAVCDYLVGSASNNCSAVNHRLYRQGKTYSVKIDLDPGSPPGQYTIWALADTWMLQKAWQLARSTYLKATADERKQLGTQTARWEDFAVGVGLTVANQQIAIAGLAGTNLSDTAVGNGEVPISSIYLETTGAQHTFSLGVTSGTVFGIFDEYNNIGRVDPDPENPTNAQAYGGVDAEINNGQLEKLQDDGNLPPYAQSISTQQAWVKVATLRNDSPEATRLSTGFFNAPLGLFVIQPPTGGFTFTDQLTMTMQAGDYKGVKAMNIGA